MDPRERFTHTAERYARFRPDYPVALLDWLGRLVPGRRAVDLGAGTGILTRQLVERGWSVIGVEPNEAMRDKAIAAGGARYVPGSAEATGLPAGSTDLVIAAQAFHWFDLDRALPEIARIRAPVSAAVAVWNVRAESGFGLAYEQALFAFSEEYAKVPRPEDTIAKLRARLPNARERVFLHAQRLDFEGVIGRAWSSSYVVRGVRDRDGFDRALGEAFRAFAEDGAVELLYETHALVW